MISNTKHPQITNYGQIKRLDLPQGWVEEQVERREFELRTIRQFHPADNSEVSLFIVYRGHPVSAESGESFERLLDEPPHVLDEPECWSVQEILGKAALPDAFAPSQIETGDWIGRRVLLVEGVWVRSDVKSFGMFINAADHGCQVQEIFFRSPAAEYVKYKHAVMGSLYSIEWKLRQEDPEP